MADTDKERPMAAACLEGRIDELLERYVQACAPKTENESISQKATQKKKEPTYKRFPNLAGFCRYLGTGTDELGSIAARFPGELGRIRAVLEDEALNASLSPTVIAAYFKRRLGYERESERTETSEIQVRFEHDIWEDGE